MKPADIAKLYAAAGFPTVDKQLRNNCGRAASPAHELVDLNGDGAPEAIVTDSDPVCYPGANRYFAVVVREGKAWRQLVSGAGSIEQQSTRHRDWTTLTITQRGCARPFGYDGARYSPIGPCQGTATPAATAPVAAKPAQPKPAAAPPSPKAAPVITRPQDLTAADRAAVFKAAGAVQRGGKWVICTDEPNQQGATIDEARDLNGDGLPEAIVNEGGLFCHGNTGNGFALVSKQANGGWKNLLAFSGFANPLKTKGVGGWPDIEIGGPGFCFPIWRWNGRAYELHRTEYEGKPCRPN